MENYNWLEVFDKEDLIELLKEILPDLLCEIEENSSYDDLSGHLSTIDNILDEGYESALAIQLTEVQHYKF